MKSYSTGFIFPKENYAQKLLCAPYCFRDNVILMICISPTFVGKTVGNKADNSYIVYNL